MGGRVRVADTASRPAAQRRVEREMTSDGYPIVPVSDYDASDAVWWARACARDFGIRPPKVKFRAPTSVRCGYVDLKIPVFIRAGMDHSETRSTIAHEIARLAGADECAARRYEATRRRGAWWAPTPHQPAEPTADEWAIHAAQLRARAGR
jgi:hypothetical protein